MPRILLVDDERVARALYGDYLRAAGHQVVEAGGLVEARRILEEEAAFDAVVTDLILPEGDGIDLLRYARSHHPGVEVVVITALDRVEPAVRAIKSGASEYLIKPVAAESLQHAVSRALATRTLLRENEALRRHVTLLETGQRIATSLEKDTLILEAAAAFSTAAGAEGLLLFGANAEGPRLLGSEGVPAESIAAITEAVLANLQQGEAPRRIAPLPGPYPEGLVIAATDAGDTWGYAVLLYGRAPARETVGAAAFMARHLALGLRNLGRFSEVEDLAYVDDLTHLFNTRYLHLALERELQFSGASGQPFSVLFLDLDYFKSINDTHGHLIGSALLVEVGKVLRGLVRDHDVVARYGGDEYVLVLRGTDSGGALKVAERIRHTVEGHFFLAREGLRLNITTCIGVASFPEHAKDKPTLLDWADRAMYRGKKGGRNVVYMAASGLEATPTERHSRPTG